MSGRPLTSGNTTTTCAWCGEHKTCPWRADDGYVCLACLGQRAEERDALRDNLKAEMDGAGALRERMGARANETMFMVVDRLVAERDAYRAQVAFLNDKLDATHMRRCFKCGETVAPEPCEHTQQESAALAAAEALEARYRAGIQHALRALHAVHANLPDGETLPRASVDGLALAVEGALLAALGGES